MPGVAPSVKDQTYTTGPNMQLEFGRVSTTLTEVIVKRCNLRFADNVQDKTGSQGHGFTANESGNETWFIDVEFINEVDSPISFDESNRLYYFKRTIKGGRIHEAYFRLDTVNDNAESNGDHVITATGQSTVVKEGPDWIYPTADDWSPTP